MRQKIQKSILLTGIIGCLSLTGCGEKSVDLANHIIVSFEGIEQVGSAYVELNEESLYDELMEKAKTKDMAQIKRLIETLAVTPNQNANLKNGDIIGIACKYDNQLAKESGIRFVYEEVEVTVENLTAAAPVSAAELLNNASIEYSGVAPNGSIKVSLSETSKEYSDFISYETDKSSGLKNNEEVNVTIKVDKDTAKENGYIVIGENLTRTIVTNGFPEYITMFDDIPMDALNQIKQQGKDEVESWKAGKRLSSSGYGATKPLRIIFMKSKYEEKGNNKLLLIYKISRPTGETYYIAAGISDLSANPNGTMTPDLENMSIVNFDTSYDSLYEKAVQYYVNDYTVSEYEYS